MKTQALTPLEASYVGDRRAGCACAYLALPPRVLHGKKVERLGPDEQLPTRLHEDVFVTGTGTKMAKFICHRALTKAYPMPIAAPAPARNRAARGLVYRLVNATVRTLHRFLIFICPRIQFGMGINLFRMN